jgi:hypothetical protein
MKKTAGVVFVTIILAAAAFGQAAATPYQRTSRFEFGFWGGYGLGSAAGSTHYDSLWSVSPLGLGLVQEAGAIDFRARNGLGIGASAAVFLSPGFGLEFSLGFAYTDAPLTSSYELTRSLLGGAEASSDFEWPGRGSLVSLPLSFDLVIRFGSGMWSGYASLGPTLFLHGFSAESHLGFATTAGPGLDALKIGLETGSKVWMAPGGNAGAGLAVKLTPMLSAVLDVRYYVSPAKTLSWGVVTGSYPGLFREAVTYPIGDPAAAVIKNLYDLSFAVRPSFLQIAAGMKLRL